MVGVKYHDFDLNLILKIRLHQDMEEEIMNQAKIGQFISYCRKQKGLTQSQLAEKFGITDKAISKWENGKSMPDPSLFMPLCSLLGISLNEFLLGEYISDEALKEKSNQVLYEILNTWIGYDKKILCTSEKQKDVILKVSGLTKVYSNNDSEVCAINNVDFQIFKGSIVGIMGASGSGKTTLLNMLATVDTPTTGTITINEQDVQTVSQKALAEFRRKNLGFVFQEYNLLDTLTIYENIALALTIKSLSKEKIKEKIENVAKTLNILDVLEKFPYEVSGGQRQRCACARAIAVNPSIILADEPTGALDTSSAKQLLDTLCLLRQKYNATILLVTHDAVSASYCDRILFLQDGKIITEIEREEESKQSFFTRILNTLVKIEEGDNHVL